MLGEKTKKVLFEMINTVAVVAFAALIIFGSVTLTKRIFKTNLPPINTTSTTVIVTPQPSQFPDWDSLKKLKTLDLVRDFESWTPESATTNTLVSETIILDKGSISKAYIYVKASINGKALTQWESVYIKMRWVGGHLFRPQSLPVPPGDKTELLFALNDIPYLAEKPYSEQRTPLRGNWFDYFKNGAKINFLTFISSLKPAKLEEVILYYDCIDACLLTTSSKK